MMQLTILLATVVAIGTILYGVKLTKSQKKTGNIRNMMLTSVGLFSAMVVGFIVCGTGNLMAAETAAEATGAALSFGDGLKYVAAALSTGLATMGTGRAVGSVGASAIGAVSEDSTILGKTLIFVGMAEGIAIYGMIISILILFI
ncbi:ATP synthase subunit C [Cellulosilyticum ruminicola]|uniref:ATP synthase subunit C n=1 Tax=Cellulosilyticum ruminicola TaxID=425254 RepID=UPI0006D0BD30|nr:ATP synthase subunit C [Cellulosilyticum ruminicola]